MVIEGAIARSVDNFSEGHLLALGLASATLPTDFRIFACLDGKLEGRSTLPVVL